MTIQTVASQTGTELCSENNRPGPDMSDEVERTKRVRGKTTPAFITFNYTEETSNLDNEMSNALLDLGWIFFWLLKCFFVFSFHLTGRDSPLPITKIGMKT